MDTSRARRLAVIDLGSNTARLVIFQTIPGYSYRLVDQVLPIATSAVREAANGPIFVQRVAREIGISLQVLDGEREAYYDTIGALNEVPLEAGAVVDIGGGRTDQRRARERLPRRRLPYAGGAGPDRGVCR